MKQPTTFICNRLATNGTSKIKVRPHKGTVILYLSDKASENVLTNYYKLIHLIRSDKEFPNQTLSGSIKFKSGVYKLHLHYNNLIHRYYEIEENK